MTAIHGERLVERRKKNGVVCYEKVEHHVELSEES